MPLNDHIFGMIYVRITNIWLPRAQIDLNVIRKYSGKQMKAGLFCSQLRNIHIDLYKHLSAGNGQASLIIKQKLTQKF